MIGLKGCASKSESNRSVHLYKVASHIRVGAVGGGQAGASPPHPPPNNFENGLWPPNAPAIILSILRFAPPVPPVTPPILKKSSNASEPANNKRTDQTVRTIDYDAHHFTFEPEHDKTNKTTYAHSEAQDIRPA